jgi:hypothetical protein
MRTNVTERGKPLPISVLLVAAALCSTACVLAIPKPDLASSGAASTEAALQAQVDRMPDLDLAAAAQEATAILSVVGGTLVPAG